MALELDFVKLPSDRRIAVWGGPSGGASGITDLHEPEADEINNVGDASGMITFSQSLSWNDTEVPGVRESDTNNEPSLADDAGYEEFGVSNYDGTLSMYRPRKYDDASNPHSLVFDLTDLQDWDTLDFAVRIDGDKDALAPAADGDYISTSRQRTMTETQPFNFDESARRTVALEGAGGFAHYTIVGDHTLTVEEAPSEVEGEKGRILVSVQGRDYTNALHFYSENPEVIRVYPGGFYEVVGTGAYTVTITDEGAGTSTTATGTAS